MLAILMQRERERETSVEVVMHCVLVQGKWEGRGHMLKAGNILQCILWYANRLFELCDAAVVTKPRNGKKICCQCNNHNKRVRGGYKYAETDEGERS